MKKIILTSTIFLLAIGFGFINVKAQIGTSTRPGLRARIEAGIDNNKDRRNINLQKREEIKDLRASTTGAIRDIRRDNREDIRDLRASTTQKIQEERRENRQEIKDFRASTTMMLKEAFKIRKNEKREIKKEMELRTFEIRKDALVKELTMSLNNLSNIKIRIDERILKSEQSGRDMSNAKAELVKAIDKLAKANTAVAEFKSFTYSTTTVATNGTSTQIRLERPRKIGDDAIKAVKDARDGFKKAVEAIAKAMGIKNATSTATSTNI